MIIDLLKFEVFYQRKQRALIGLAIVFLFYGLMLGQQNYAPANVNFNSAHQLSYYTSFMSLGTVFIIMFFAISGLLRDLKHKMDSIIFTTSITKFQFFVSRFLGVFLFGLLAFTPFFIGFLIGTQSPGLDPDRLSEFNLMAYLWPWFIFILPNTFIMSAILFSVALLTKNNVATYLGATCIYVLYIICSIVLNSPLIAQSIPPTESGMMMAALLDPFGIAAFFEQTQFWTPFEKNTELLSLSGFLLKNRLIWMLFGFGILALSYKLFSFKMANQRLKKEKKAVKIEVSKMAYRTIDISLNTKGRRLAFISLVQSDIRATFKSLPFWAMILVWLFIVISEFVSRIQGGGEYHDSLYATSNILISNYTQPLGFFALLLIVFYSAELANRSRDYKFDGILDVTPVSNIALFMSKWVSLLLLPIILISSAILMSVIFQISKGFYDFNWPLYTSLFYYNGAEYVFYSIFALFLQSIIPNKYLGMGLTVLAIALLNFAGPSIGIQHPMLRLGYIPLPSYSEMNGFAQSTKAFYHLTLYWFSLGGILAVISFKLLKRGANSDFKSQVQKLTSGWGKGQLAALSIFGILFLSSAGLVYYNTNVLSEYRSMDDYLNIRETYERKFKQYDGLATLSRIALKTELDLYPSEQNYDLRADEILKNESSKPISKMLVQEQEQLTKIQIEGANLVEYDSLTGTYLFEFDQPIQPEEEVGMTYEINKRLKGYEADISVVKNGTYLAFNAFYPNFGYSIGREIASNFEREKRGLPKKEQEASIEEHLEVYGNKLDRATFETVISTEADQTAVSSGNLINQWTAGDRSYFHYKTATAILPAIGYFSADFSVKKDLHNGISIEQYYHANNGYNVDRITESTELTLDYCIENFGAYPFDYIRIAEVPAHWSFGGYAHPGLISMVEDRLYLADIRDPKSFDIVAKRTIHEVAHQWWGHILSPSRGEGASFFVEGLAQYTEAIIMEKRYGKSAVWNLAENANRRYFQGRSFTSEPEPAIYKQLGESYLGYGKNLTVMLALVDLIGEDTVNQVLRTITDRQRQDNNYPVNTLVFLEELNKVTPYQHHALIDDWFKKVITYDLSIEETEYQQLASGKYEVTLTVNAKRFQTLEDGSSEQIAIDEPISIGLFTDSPENIRDEKSIIYLAPHQINQAQMQFKMIVDQLPTHVSIDPFGTRSDDNLFDNTIRLVKQ
jgi:ABC-type transport system involved in multi-copper enzyme maturation permease subunit